MERKDDFILLEPNEFGMWLSQQVVLRKVSVVQEHSTWKPSYVDFTGNNHFELQLNMEHYHMADRGWSDIGQHLTIFPDGKICTGRPLDRIPAGIRGANQEAIMIENVGNFDLNKDVMLPAQRESIINVTASLLKRFGIIPDHTGIIYHHWFNRDTGVRTNGAGNTKSCPGTAFFGGNTVQNCVDNFIPLVASKLAALDIHNPDDGAIILKSGQIIADRLNVRYGPSSQNSVIDVLTRGARVNCYQIERRWWRIHNIESRWVYCRFVEEI